MSDYSSDGEDDYPSNSRTESTVYLGFADLDVSIPGNEEPTINDTFIGNKPIWLNNTPPKDSNLLKCPICNDKMGLFLQAYSPLDDIKYDEFISRVLYIFGCLKHSCFRKSKNGKSCFRVIKGIYKDLKAEIEYENEQKQKIKKQKEQELRNASLGNDIFNSTDNSNPFDGDGNTTNPFASITFPALPGSSSNSNNNSEKVKTKGPSYAAIASSKESKVTESEATESKLESKLDVETIVDLDLPTLPGYFIGVSKEVLKKPKIPDNFKYTIDTEIEEEETTSSSNKKDNIGSLYEGTNIDSSFQHFLEIVSSDPEQVLRYNRGGRPLLYSSKGEIYHMFNGHKELPQGRIFELQLMPYLISIFEDSKTEKEILEQGMEWGTLIVTTAADDTNVVLDEKTQVGYVEEWIGVQWEDLE